MDERITLEPVHDETGHYVIATVKLAKIVPQKCDGKTPREAVEEAASMLIDLCDVLFDEAEENRADLARLRRENEALREALEAMGSCRGCSAIRCDLWDTHEYSYECQGKNQSVCVALAAWEKVRDEA